MAYVGKRELVNFPGVAKSKVWKHFGFWKYPNETGPAETKKDKAVCKICMMEYSYCGNTTNLMNHLMQKHRECMEVTRDVGKRQISIQDSMGGGDAKKPTMPLSRAREGEITDVICEFLINDLRPLSTVEGEGFRNLIKTLEPRYNVPCRKTFTETHLRAKYNTIVNSLKAQISSLPSCSITHDGWTSIATESYSTVTVHYIDQNWELKSGVLQTKKVFGQHTAECIKSDLLDCKEVWGLPDIIGTTDSAANERKAFELLDWLQLSCMGHNLNLAVRASLGNKDVAKILAKGRKIVAFFNRSSSALCMLQEKQRLLLPEKLCNHKLLQDVQTRWNSSLDMLERLLEQCPAIHATLIDPIFKKSFETKSLFTTDDQTNVEAIIEFLQPFKGATIALSREDVPTLPAVLPTLAKLDKHLTPLETDSTLIKNLKKEAKVNLDKRYKSEKQQICLGISSLLHPATKKLQFMTDEEKERVTIHIICQMIDTFKPESQEVKIKNEAGEICQNLPDASCPSSLFPTVKVEPGQLDLTLPSSGMLNDTPSQLYML